MVVWGLWPQWGPGVESLVTTGARGRSPAEAKNFLALRRSKEGEIYLSRPVVKLLSKRWWIPVGATPKLEPEGREQSGVPDRRAFKALCLAFMAFK